MELLQKRYIPKKERIKKQNCLGRHYGAQGQVFRTFKILDKFQDLATNVANWSKMEVMIKDPKNLENLMDHVYRYWNYTAWWKALEWRVILWVWCSNLQLKQGSRYKFKNGFSQEKNELLQGFFKCRIFKIDYIPSELWAN